MFNIIVSLGILLLSISFALCGTVRRADRTLPNPEEDLVPEDNEEYNEEEEEDNEEEQDNEEEEDNDEEEENDESENGEPTAPPLPAVDAPPETDEISKSDLDYLKAQLIFYRDEKIVCEAKMATTTITLESYNTLKKYWDGLTTMITELEEIIG